MKPVSRILLFVVILLSLNASAHSQPTKKEYLRFINSAVEYNLKEYNNIINRWKSNIKESELFGYSTTSYPANFAELLGFMYEQTGDEKYVKKAVELLLVYEDLKKIFPKKFYEDRVEYAKGLPPISDFFSMYSYPRAYLFIKGSKNISEKDRKTIEEGVADCANFLMNYPEWGPMNRAILRAETFFYSAFGLPDHPDAKKWKKMAQVLSSDSYQRWEEEDASHYHPVWLLSLMRVVDTMNDAKFYRSSVPRYYLDYFANMIHPYGLIPDFGDGRWPSDWFRFIPIFEKGASVYKDPLFKWAAKKTWEFNRKYYADNRSAYVALVYVNAFKWCDESVKAEPPAPQSRLVMEDIVGKKIVFRNGTDNNSTYLLLNYRDQGDGAYTGREFLRTTIPVEEEKMHHGHSDENSVVSLFYNGSVLLHDGGYRSALPSGPYGEWRADYYHNRIVIRKNKKWRQITGEQKQEQPLWEFLRNSGAYRPVNTKLINFITFEKADYSRSRLSDKNMGYEWDRTVVYHKEGQFFIVFDTVKPKVKDYFTFANIWHTQRIISQGDRWFDTRIDSINGFQVPGENNLLVYFPVQEYVRSVGSYEEKRHWQDEIALYETLSSHYYPEQTEVFITVLFPHTPDISPESIVKRFEFLETDKFPQAAALKYSHSGTVDHICVKLDQMLGYRQQNIRTRYDFNKGKVAYGPFTTDGYFLFTSRTGNKLYWGASNMVKVLFKDKILHESLLTSFNLQLDSAPVRSGRAKWRYWEETVNVK